MDTRDSIIDSVIEENDLLKGEIARLKKVKSYYQTLLDRIDDAIIGIDPEGRILHINRNAELICGRSQEEVRGQPLRQVLIFSDGSMKNSEDGDLERSSAPYSFDYAKLTPRNGREMPVSIDARPLCESSEEVEGTLLIINKLPEKDRTTLSRDEEISNLTKYHSENPNPVLRIADNGNVLYANKPAEKVLDSWQTSVGHPVPLRWKQAITETLRKDQIRLEEDTVGDRRISFSILPVKEAYYVNLYAQDITERGLAQKSALEQEKRFRLTFEQAAVGIAHVGLGGHWLRVNRKLCEIVGYPLEELLTMTFQDITHPDDLEADLNFIKQILAGEIENYDMEKRYIRKDASIVWINLTVALARDAVGNPDYFISVVEDITSKIEYREELSQQTQELARSNRELEQFAYVASHDLQEPLRQISSYVHLLAERYADHLDEKGHRWVGYTTEGVARMKQLINDLLTYSRIKSKGRPLKCISTDAILDAALQNLASSLEESQAQIERSPLPHVWGDATQIVQLFQNLIGNAIKFRRGDLHPHIRIAAQRSAEDADTDFWIFSVTDNGIGIESQHFERIFTIFQRLHTREDYPGNGIGLALCSGIVQRHGGKIWVESITGSGSTFYFSLKGAEHE